MSAINTKSTKAQILSAYNDLQRELELVKRQLQDALTEKGALLSQLATQEPSIPQHFQESYAALADECKQLIAENQRLVESCAAAHKRCDALEAIVAKSSAPKPAFAQVELAPVVQITDADRRVWAAFQALPREKRQSYYEFARSTVGHLGIHNIVAVREAYLAQQAA